MEILLNETGLPFLRIVRKDSCCVPVICDREPIIKESRLDLFMKLLEGVPQVKELLHCYWYSHSYEMLHFSTEIIVIYLIFVEKQLEL